MPIPAVLKSDLKSFHENLVQILIKGNTGTNLNHVKLKENVFNFSSSTPKPTIKQKAEVNHLVRENIINFITVHLEPVLAAVAKKKKDPYYFVERINQIWPKFEVYVFAHDFVMDKLKQFFDSFYKFNNARDFSKNNTAEVVAIPIMAVNELKKSFQKFDIFAIFPDIFNEFIVKERSGVSVPRQMLKDSVEAIESCFFDFEATIRRDVNGKVEITKNIKTLEYKPRKSTDAEYFEENIMQNVLNNCREFYVKKVKENLPQLTPIEEVHEMLRIISEEESRSVFYIHTVENQNQYRAIVDEYLIGEDLETRIKREEGLIKYLRAYQVDQPECKEEIGSFWEVYSRIIDRSISWIVGIYSRYLDEEAVEAEKKLEKPMDFINEMIRINSKNMQVVKMMGNHFDLESKRNEKIRGMLSNEVVKESKQKGKHTLGATHLANFVNVKFKEIYVKGLQGNEQIVHSLELLFKILQEKVHFTKEHEKHIGNRLLEEVDFNKDFEYTNIVNLEKGFINEMQKEMGPSEVKELSKNIADLQKSYEHTKKLKEKKGSSIHVLNQIIIKNNTFWQERNSYEMAAPNCLFKVASEVEGYFSQTSNISIEFNNGVSVFRGEFSDPKVPRQMFQLKNIYMMILLLIDEEPSKRMLFGDLKNKIKSYGSKKEKGNLELIRNVVELLNIGLLTSSTKELRKDDPNCAVVHESDSFALNREFNYEEQLKKNRVPPKMIKRLQVIKSSNIQMIPDWLKKAFAEASKSLAVDEVQVEKERKLRVKAIAVKCLKHAHHSNKNCSFEQMFEQYSEAKNKQYRVTEKYLKEVIEELINDEFCERVEGQRNVFKYKA